MNLRSRGLVLPPALVLASCRPFEAIEISSSSSVMSNAGLNYCSKLEISLAKGAQVYFVPTLGTLDSLLAWGLHGCVSPRGHVTLSSLCPGTGALALEARGEEHTVKTESFSEFSKSA